jgi:tight adherence protein B
MIVAVALLFMVALGGAAFAFTGSNGASKKRIQSVAGPQWRAGRSAAETSAARRKNVATMLKDIEKNHAAKKEKPTMRRRLEQAGFPKASPKTYWIICAIVGAVTAVACLVTQQKPLVLALATFAMGFGLPRWVLGFLKKRREKLFLKALPDAVDVIVRGIKAGLPLFESIKVVAADSPEPLRGEFLAIIETQAIGMPLGEACARLFERMPVPEANFFGIVIAIQQKSGGNLSEALGNLSKVLRDRKKMAEKIQAMSMEAKASAGIIGSLPPIVMLLVYLSTPQYISLLWTHPTGQLMLVGCVIWMSLGIFVMKRMINFDF